MGYIFSLKVCIFLVALLLSAHLMPVEVFAESGKWVVSGSSSEREEPDLLDKNMIDVIDKYSLNKQNNPESSENSIAVYNINHYTANKASRSPKYLDNSIFAKSSISMLEKILPVEYSLLDMPKRDNAPIHRLGTSLNMNQYPEYGNTIAGITNVLLNVVFGTLTRNTLSMNVNRIDNNDSVSLSLTPVKGLALKVGLENDRRRTDKSIFEVKYKYSNASNIKLKTSESPAETKAGIEFELAF